MNKSAFICLCLIFSGIFLATEELSAQSDIRDMVIERRDLMFSMLHSYWPLLDIKKGKSTDLVKAGAAAQMIRDTMVKLSKLFPAGTAMGEVEGTWSRAKPDIWKKPTEFEAAVNELISASTKLADISNSGDLEEFKAQFQVFEKACLGCHEFKPSGGGKFRFPHI